MRSVVTWARTVGVAGALLAGCLGSAAAVRVSGFPGPPAEADAVAVAVTAVGQRPIDTPGPVVVCEFFCPDYDGDAVVAYDAEPDHTDVVAVTYELPGTYASAVETAAEARLVAAGWQPRADSTFTRDGHVVDVQTGDTAGGVRATIVVSKAVQAPARALAAAGFLLGTVLGWLLVRRAHRRFRRHGPAVILVAGTLTVVATAFILGYAVLAVLMIANDGPQQPDVQLADFLLTVFRPITVMVLGAALLALALIGLPPRPGPAGRRFGPPVGHTGGHGAARS